MTPELIGIITVGIALAALNFTMFNMLSKRLERLEDRVPSLENCVSDMESRLARLEGLIDSISDMDRRLARLEGLIDGIRESLVDRVRT